LVEIYIFGGHDEGDVMLKEASFFVPINTVSYEAVMSLNIAVGIFFGPMVFTYLCNYGKQAQKYGWWFIYCNDGCGA
jgi:hypothetical protein